MKKILVFIIGLVVAGVMTVQAQSAETLYKEGKALYDAKNYTAAFPKLKAAAEKGHRKAQYRLGRCYDKGHGVAENDETAFLWYSKSAAQDYAKAQYRVGKCYMKGKGTTADEKKATTWLTRAVKNPKGGNELLAKLRKEASENDEDAKKILKLIGK